MGHERVSYRDFVRSQCRANPCVTGLADYLCLEPEAPSTIVILDYPQGRQVELSPSVVTEADLIPLIHSTSAGCGRIILVENIRPSLISLLGEILDIDPVFFAGHVTTGFEDVEEVPPPPSLALFPSQFAERGQLHLHYQQVLDLGSADAFKGSPYSFETDSNIPRNVRRLPKLSGRQLALARVCCSISMKKLNNSWICLVLVDPPVKTVVGTSDSSERNTYLSKPLNGGFEQWVPPTSFASFQSTAEDKLPENKSMLHGLLNYLRRQPPELIPAEPSILSLSFYPIRIVLAEWNIYTLLMSRYFKYYEYTLRDIENRLHDADIVDLQRWRRRSTQSQHKLRLLNEFIHYWLEQEAEKQPWNLVLKDVEYVLIQLERYSRLLEQMIPMATTMVQLLDSRHWMLETANVSRLTFIALVFVPLSWVASLFSMSEGFSPGQEHFWVYFAAALPLLFLVLLLSAIQWNQLAGALQRFRGFVTCEAGTKKTRVGEV
ncbi:hypothetical protein GQ53DRAFT_499463 [Thozetella sp. PMI_491]|nr:hypothetical protein GQ53DRAFT_499463 [Thozetella sp. PMI_491]